MFFVYLIISIVASVYYYVKKKLSFFEDRGIPYIKPKFLFGNVAGAGSKYHFFNIMEDYYKKIPGRPIVAGFYTFISPTFIIFDLEAAKQILIKDFNNFVNRGQYHNEEGDPLSANLFNIEDDKWRFLRNKLSPAFTSGKIKSMFEVVKSKGDKFAHAIERDSKLGAVEMKGLAHRFTLDIISSVAFGMEADTLNGKNPELVHFSHECLGSEGASFIKIMFMMVFPKFSKFLNLKVFTKNLSDYFINIVSKNISYREKNGEKRNDFLNMLIELKNKGSIEGEISSQTQKLTLLQCVAQSFIFFIGGSDTSSTTISFAMGEIAQDQEMQEKIRSEINEKTKGGEINYENLQDMTYLNQVVNGK
jgi:cytochrome P450 family 6